MYTDITSAIGGKKPRHIKEYNTNLVLSLFRQTGKTTMTEIAEKTALSRTTISKIFSRLSEKGIIVPIGHGNSSSEGGKPPLMYSLRPDYCYSVLLSAGSADHITCSIVDLAGNNVYRCRQNTNPDLPYEDGIAVMAGLIKESIHKTGIPVDKICGVAILYDGVIDHINGLILNSAYRPWAAKPVCSDLQKATEIDFYVALDNASNFSGYAETLFCSPAENKMVVIWDMDRTLGYCMLSGQSLVGNNEGITGGFSHVILDPSSHIPCACGAHGCLHSLLSNEALLDYAGRVYKTYPDSPLTKEYSEGSLNMPDVFSASKNNDPFAIDLLRHIVRYFSILTYNIYNLYSVQEIILQGMFSLSGDVFADMLRNEVLHFNKLRIYRQIRVSYSRFSPGQPLENTNPYHIGANILLSDRYINID